MPNWYDIVTDRVYGQDQRNSYAYDTTDLQRLISAAQGITSAGTTSAGGPRPQAKEPTAAALAVAEPLEPEFADEYRALAAELGLNPTPIDTAQFTAWLSAQGLPVYTRAEVQEYLHCKYQVPVGNVTSLVSWGWRPLRMLDRKEGHTNSKNGTLQRGAAPYAKPIPYPVLLTIKSVRDQFPTAKFFVSDEMHAERIPDPFLLVEIGTEKFVIERWDEPAFRAKK